jgi:hypothetical protein
MENLSLLDDFSQEPIVFAQATLDLLGRPNDQIERKGPLECSINPDGLVDHVVGWHDDQQIDVALDVRRAVSVGAEQEDLLRPEALGDRRAKRRIAARGMFGEG